MMDKKTQKKGLKIQYNTKKSVIYLIIAIPTIVFIIWDLFCGSIQIRCNDRDFNIEAKGWNDYTGEYSQIDSISYEVNVLQNDNDHRTNGFGNLKYAMGNFNNDIFGDYIRYTHASCHLHTFCKTCSSYIEYILYVRSNPDCIQAHTQYHQLICLYHDY